jgi:glycosyltransferase involved in cell wall biosynthesis
MESERVHPQTASDDALARGRDGVDPSWYLAQYPDVAAGRVDPVVHYLQSGWREGRDPRPDFSTLGYLALNDDVARSGQNPLIHYLHTGGPGSFAHTGGKAYWHRLWRTGLLHPKTGDPPPTAAQPFGSPGRKKLLFVGHEATRTGAPLILLALMEALGRLTGAELYLVLERDGPLLEDYRRVAHVLVNRNGALYGPSVPQLLDELATPAPDLALCNCAETWRLMEEVRRAGIPRIVALVHERMSHFPDEVGRVVHRAADRVIFPARAVKMSAVRFFPQYRDADVVPQGLLKDDFGLSDKAGARKTVRDELGLSADVRIVLGCGVRQPRKGLDLFIQLAARVRSQTDVPVRFLWVGGDALATEFKQFVQHDIALLDLDADVQFIDETVDPERYFQAADVYALTSRDDPFPCVVHEAMACALPVVAFDRAGGAGEALAEGCGIIVPYLDLDAMAQQVCAVMSRPADFAAMGKRAERLVRSMYRFADYAQRILAICRELELSRPQWPRSGGCNPAVLQTR